MKVRLVFLRLSAFILSLFIILTGMFTIYPSGGVSFAEDGEENSEETEKKLEVHYLDAKNGDCTFIKCGNFEMLIDFGDNATRSELQEIVPKYFEEYCTDSVLEYLVVTHGDADHIGNASKIIDNVCDKYTVKNIIDFDGAIRKDVYTENHATYYKRLCIKKN